MLIKCYEHVHPLVKSDINFANQYIFDQDCNLDNFEQTTSTSERIE